MSWYKKKWKLALGLLAMLVSCHPIDVNLDDLYFQQKRNYVNC